MFHIFVTYTFIDIFGMDFNFLNMVCNVLWVDLNNFESDLNLVLMFLFIFLFVYLFIFVVKLLVMGIGIGTGIPKGHGDEV